MNRFAVKVFSRTNRRLATSTSPWDYGRRIATDATRPFRFYDNRQKYLTFVTTCDEKWRIAERAASLLPSLRPQPPALRVFDAGVGDGTVLAHLIRAMHQQYPTMPFYVVGKEISLEDVRLSLEKLPDRLVEHPHSVIVITNLHYAESPSLTPHRAESAERMTFRYVELEGTGSHAFYEQLRALDPFLVDQWQVRPSERTGNPLYVNPSALVIYRKDHCFALDSLIPKAGETRSDYDLILASQPWRSRTGAEFKVRRILAPLSKSLRSHGVLLGVQSQGGDPGLEIIRRIWPDEDPFPVGRHELIEALRDELAEDGRDFDLMSLPEDSSLLRYTMHTLPSEIGNTIGTSTLFAAWNAAIYVSQIEDARVEEAVSGRDYLDATSEVLQERGGLWFNDETFLVRRH